MATRSNISTWLSKRVLRTQWTGLLNGDDGNPETPGRLSDRSVQISGTFGAGGSISIQGSNDGINWTILRDPAGAALTFTTADLKEVLENTQYIRPVVTAGDGTTSLTVNLLSASTA